MELFFRAYLTYFISANMTRNKTLCTSEKRRQRSHPSILIPYILYIYFFEFRRLFTMFKQNALDGIGADLRTLTSDIDSI